MGNLKVFIIDDVKGLKEKMRVTYDKQLEESMARVLASRDKSDGAKRQVLSGPTAGQVHIPKNAELLHYPKNEKVVYYLTWPVKVKNGVILANYFYEGISPLAGLPKDANGVVVSALVEVKSKKRLYKTGIGTGHEADYYYVRVEQLDIPIEELKYRFVIVADEDTDDAPIISREMPCLCLTYGQAINPQTSVIYGKPIKATVGFSQVK